MKKINILLISPFFYPHIGGSQQYMEELYTFLLKKFPNISVDVLCYNSDNSKDEEKYQNFSIFRINCWQILPGQFAIPNPVQLVKFFYLQKGKYDLIHTSTRFFESSWWAPIYARIIKRKIFLTDHCGDFPIHSNLTIKFVAKWVDIITSLIFLRLYNKIFVTSSFTKNFLKKTWGTNSKLIYGGARLYEKKSKTNQVLFAGRMIESKGVMLLFEIAKNNFPNSLFVFAGPGPLVKKLQSEISSQNIKNIQILGGVSHRKILELMSKSTILAHPSFHNEGFPNVLTEAGGNHMAVLATDVGGSSEIIINNKTGFLIKPHDKISLNNALKKLLNDFSLRNKLSQNLYNHLKNNFSWNRSAEILYTEIKDTLEHRV